MGNHPSNLDAGVAVIVLNGDKVLLGKRTNTSHSGYFALPGGQIENGENILEASKRELEEEVGVTMLKGNVITVNSIHYVKERVLFLGFAVLCEKYEGEIKNCEPHKCEGWQFYPINKLPEDTLDFHRTFLKNYIDSISYTEEVK